ncbi:MAG: hypothetical protein WC821_05290 [archaeon]|jgi:hypothetical protein
MSDCFFCGTFVGEENGDGGCKGRTIGNKDVCEQCMGELKHWLNGTIPRSPSMREQKLDEEAIDETNESNSSTEETNDDSVEAREEDISDPFSASPKD